MEVLDRPALTRATLARQHLLARAAMPAADMVAHLVGLQAQAPFPPYFGLWSRLAGFTAEELVAGLTERRLVRVGLHRGTVHLVTAEDALRIRPVLAPLYARFLQTGPATAGQLDGVDLDDLARAGRELLAEEPRTLADLGGALAPTWPDHDPRALAHAVHLLVPLVQAPPRALWGRSGAARFAPLEDWLGAPPDPDPSPDDLVLRYLGAFGPASFHDAQRWIGLTGLRAVFERLRPGLVAFRSEAGRTLLDLPDAPRPGPDVDLPIRLVAAYDDLLLGHDERSRVYDREHKARLFPVNAVIPATVLVDGRVAGTWTWTATARAAGVAVTPFARWPARVRQQVEAEAHDLLARAAADLTPEVTIANP